MINFVDDTEKLPPTSVYKKIEAERMKNQIIME